VAIAGVAEHDGIAGPADRAGLIGLLEATRANAERDGRAIAVLSLDLDGFRVVHDRLDRAGGDKLLRQIADRIQAVMRPGDRLARVGGDRFVAILVDLDPLDAARVADRVGSDILADLQRPFTVGSVRTMLHGSFGVSVFPDDATTSESLLAGVDAARSDGARLVHGGARAATR
jgi:diguanylate cyclase (GGDEF)-like protein